ncbi:DoxX family protein [Actinomycetospora sp. TBRC 11914]|uniref:DoxX family protein n=1 Tax=Actinomycetospora sp. TBRC 11914 TaxID=2729387 RepID=UPI00145D4F49|nr:DoxX family protein [Actinomycetospora sp. TBRC 11914]NMO88732.1 DoxX family protein [Actinomycetospora sp. TBRC 11914]
MTTATRPESAPAAPGRPRTVTAGLWTLQVLLALLFVGGSGLPKLVGESYAVQIFDELGSGQWLRIVVGLCEVAGGLGLLVPRLAGLAATCLIALMVGATAAQLFFLDAGYWYTPVIVGALLVVIARTRRTGTAALVTRA